MLFHITFGAEKPLLLAGPKGNADGATRFDVKCLQNTHRFHGYDSAGAVIGGPGACNPAIEMATYHDDLFFQFGVGAGNLSDGIESVFMLAGESGFNIDFDADGHMSLSEPVKATIAFNRGHHHGHFHAPFSNVRSAAERGAVVVKKCAPGTTAILAVSARLDNCGYLFFSEELCNLVDQLLAFDVSLETSLHLRRNAACICVHRKLGKIVKFLFAVTVK